MYLNYNESDFDESKAPDVTAWKLSRSAIEHENVLIHHRLTWFFAGQAFLLTGFFTVANNAQVFSIAKSPQVSVEPEQSIFIAIAFLVIGLLAIFISAATANGLRRAYISLDRITKQYVRIARAGKFFRTPPIHLWTKPSALNILYIPNWVIVGWILLELTVIIKIVFSSGNFRNLFDWPKLSLDNYIALAPLVVSGFGVYMSWYLHNRAETEQRAEHGLYWEEDEQGRLLEDDIAEALKSAPHN